MVLARIVLAFSIATFGLLAPGREAVAQVPPHTPGTVCFTSTFWCWAQPPGAPGAPCACPSPTGYVAGTLG